MLKSFMYKMMNTKMNGLNLGYQIIIDKSMLQKRDVFPYEREVNPNGFEHNIIAGIDTNNTELQVMENLLTKPNIPLAWGTEDN